MGYPVSEHSTILGRFLGTSARAPSVNTASVIVIVVVISQEQKYKNVVTTVLERALEIKSEVTKQESVGVI